MIKRIISISLAILVFFNISIVNASSSKVKISVTLESIECISNNHVGNDWGFNCTVNKKDLSEGDSIEISTTLSGKITIKSTAEEYDKYPDIGSKSLTISVSKLKPNTDNTYSSSVTVRENRGRYSGNTATWKFIYIIQKL